MKQFVYAKSMATGTPADISAVAANVLGIYHLDDTSKYLTSSNTVTKNFAIVAGTANGQAPIVFPEVDFSSLTVIKADPIPGTAKIMTMKVATPSTVKDSDLTITFIKKGVVFNERNKWSVNVFVKKGTSAANAAKALADAVTDYIKGELHFASVTASSDTITVTGTIGYDFEISGYDTENGIATVATTTAYVAPRGQKAQLEELYQACVAGRGMKYFGGEGKELYPGYPEAMPASATVYTLRFKVGRSAAKTRDEQVYQVIHIATNTTDVITALDAILTGVPTPSVEDGD